MTIRAVLTDIEGTTSSIAFVTETLFPYARARLAGFVAAHPKRVAGLLDDVRAECKDTSLNNDEIIDILRDWIDEDRKATPLKTLQGMIWAEGYADGTLTGHVYPDAAAALRRWHADGLKLYVYSSGSVEAQKLIFGHSNEGDLTPLFSGYFDTTTGPKREAASYRAIADAVGLTPGAVLFLSDVQAEIDAAATAGMAVRLVDRDGATAGAAVTFDEIIP